jgi:hypothetical protein
MATGAKRSVILGKVTPNGGARNGDSNGGSNGAASSPSMSSAAHKAKASRPTNAARPSVTQKAKAAAR